MFRLGVSDLPTKYSQMVAGGLYLAMVEEVHALSLVLPPLLQANQAAQLIFSHELALLVDQAAPHAARGSWQYFQLDVQESLKPAKALLKQLSKELDFFAEQQPQLAVVLLPLPSNVQLAQWIAALHLFQQWLVDKPYRVLMLFNGFSSEWLEQLLQHSKTIDGLAYCHGFAGIEHWYTDFWRHQDGMAAQGHYIFRESADGIKAKPVVSRASAIFQPREVAGDAHLILAHEHALDASRVPMGNLESFADHDALLARSLTARAATVVLLYNPAQELKQLAEMCFQLRSKVGEQLKIVVRCHQLAIRHQQERCLLTMGANLICYSDMSMSRILSQIESLQGVLFTRTLPSHFEDAYLAMQPKVSSNLLTSHQFVEEVRKLRQQGAEFGVHGVMVVLQLVKGLNAGQAIPVFDLSRQGDLLCAAGPQLYLYLHGCRANDVNAALARVFPLRLSDFFSGHVVFFQDKDILQYTEPLLTQPDQDSRQYHQHPGIAIAVPMASEPTPKSLEQRQLRPAAVRVVLE